MKTYIKPNFEFVEMQVEERLAGCEVSGECSGPDLDGPFGQWAAS